MALIHRERPEVHNSPENDELDKGAIHRDKLKKVIGSAVAIPLAAGAVFLATRNGDESNEGMKAPVPTAASTPNITPTNEIPAPTPSVETPAPSPTPEAVEKTIGGIVVKSLDVDPDLMRSLDNASPEEFEAFPIDARTDWVLEKYNEIANTGYLNEFFTQPVSDVKKLYDYNPINFSLTSSADGQSIIDQNHFAEQMVMAWKTNIIISGNGALDTPTANKLLSGYAADPDSYIYQRKLSRLEPDASRIFENLIAEQFATKTSKSELALQADGENRYQKTITNIASGNTFQETYVFIDKSKVLGEGNGLWLLKNRTKLN